LLLSASMPQPRAAQLRLELPAEPVEAVARTPLREVRSPTPRPADA
jgi:hypothetical protein